MMQRSMIAMRTTRIAVVAGLLGLLSVPASAQAQYDANCDKRNYTADELLQQELCSSHIGCKLALLAEKACKAKDFLGNLGNTLLGRSTPDNYDVLQALNQSEVVQTPGVKQINSGLSRDAAFSRSRMPSYDRSNAAQVDWQQAFYGPPQTGVASGQLRKKEGGGLSWFEGTGVRNKAGLITGTGTEIESDGSFRAGATVDGGLGGPGVMRTKEGHWVGGKFEAGSMVGQGYLLIADPAAKPPVLEGTFVNGQPDGMMLSTWPDFSSRKELWRGGQLIAVGTRVARGVIPTDPKSPEQEAADKAAADQAAFASQLASQNNPGALYAIGDEWAEKGDMTKARTAWRELLTRFPDSPLAGSAASRLSGASSTPKPAESASASASASSDDTCDASAKFRETMANEDYYLAKTLPGGSGYGGSRDIYKYMYLKTRVSLAIHDKYKACDDPEVYASHRKYLEDTMNVALNNCMALSSDGGHGCTQE